MTIFLLKHYIFDATIPAEYDGEMTPIITEIPEKVFDELKSPESTRGYSATVSHYNPLRDMDVEITYDAGRKKCMMLLKISQNKKNNYLFLFLLYYYTNSD